MCFRGAARSLSTFGNPYLRYKNWHYGTKIKKGTFRRRLAGQSQSERIASVFLTFDKMGFIAGIALATLLLVWRESFIRNFLPCKEEDVFHQGCADLSRALG